MRRASMRQVFSGLVIAAVMSAMACVATSDGAGDNPPASRAQHVEQVPGGDVSTTTSAESLLGVCTPGEVRSCCPFSNGCGCLGDQACDDTGAWGTCRGARPHGKGCP